MRFYVGFVHIYIMNQMTLCLRQKMQNAKSGGLRSSTLPVSPQYRLNVVMQATCRGGVVALLTTTLHLFPPWYLAAKRDCYTTCECMYTKKRHVIFFLSTSSGQVPSRNAALGRCWPDVYDIYLTLTQRWA